jgi:hypothetical protein
VKSLGTVPAPLLFLATPDELGFIQWLNPRITRPMLEEISANDRGDDSSKHFAAIQGLLRPNPPLGLLPWWPREVLELERWGEPDKAHTNQPPSGERGHLKRLFACVILLRNGAYLSGEYGLSEEDFFLQTSAATLDRLTCSAIAVKAPQRALGFILWLFQEQAHPGLRAFIAFCALALASALSFAEMAEADVMKVCDWVDREEKLCREALGDDVGGERWLIGLNSYEKRSSERWALLARNLTNSQRKFSEGIDLRFSSSQIG